MATQVFSGNGYEDVPVPIKARVKNIHTDVDITQATISGITVDVWDTTDPDTTTYSNAALTVASVVYDTLQTWPDHAGYNLFFMIPASAVPTAGRTYRIEVWITPSGSEKFVLAASYVTENVFKS